jgi:MinD-like ATPase involved in chromosome partitioning or flagellar assembly
LFNLDEDDFTYSLNDYLSGKSDIQQTVHTITSRLHSDMKGEVFFIPASSQADDIARVLKHSHDMEQLNAGLQQFAEELRLDVLFVDPPSGLTEEALFIIGISDTVVILMRPDQQDYQGTGIMIDVIRKLEIPQLLLLVNEVPIAFDLKEVRTRISQTYNCQVAAVVPHSNEMMTLDSNGIFVLRYPNDPLTELYRQIANKLVV